MTKITFLLVLLLSLCGGAQAQIITTIAGGGTNDPGDGGPATDAVLYNFVLPDVPQGIRKCK